MATALISGLLKNDFPAQHIIASDPSAESLERLRSRFGVRLATTNPQAVAEAEIIVLSVKPQVMQAVCVDITGSLAHRPLVISIAAGIELASIDTWLGGALPLIRCMPNTPAQVLKGASVLYANQQVSAAQKLAAKSLFSAIGIAEWLDDERLMDAVTAVSGSGPAYVFLVIEAMEQAAVQLGLTPEIARQLVTQTVAGAAAMVQSSDLEPAQLKRNVMSPGGTTERAIQVFEQQGLVALFAQAINAAAQRSRELSEQLKG